MYNYSIEFEYDEAKSKLNVQKHGLSFEEAKQLWAGRRVETDGRVGEEPRKIIIGKLNGKFYSCIYTVRGSKVRIISARRSRDHEEKIYTERNQNEEDDIR